MAAADKREAFIALVRTAIETGSSRLPRQPEALPSPAGIPASASSRV